jgi:hypothetical protein
MARDLKSALPPASPATRRPKRLSASVKRFGEEYAQESKKVKPDDDDDDAEYEVENIVDMRKEKGAQPEYRIRWKGYGEADDTWEPMSNLSDMLRTKAACFEKTLLAKQQKEKAAAQEQEQEEEEENTEEESGGPGTSRDDAGWQVQLARLGAYKRRHGDCNVPRGWAEDPPLGSWVKKQRAGKKLLDRGESSTRGMTAERAAKLDALGLAWAARGSGSGGGGVLTAEKRRRLAKRAEESAAEEAEGESEAEAVAGRPGGRERRAPTRWSADPLPVRVFCHSASLIIVCM